MRRLLAVIGIEIDQSYRFPVIEGLSAILVFLCFLNGMYGARSSRFYMDDQVFVSEFPARVTKELLFGTMLPYANLVIFLIPALVSFAIAKPIEDGFIRTLLTYPVKRSTLIIGKMLLAIAIPGTIMSLSLIAICITAFPIFPELFDLGLGILSIWAFVFTLTSTIAFASIILKNAGATALLGVGVWFSMHAVAAAEGIPDLVRTALNPVMASIDYIAERPYAVTLDVLLVGICISFAVALVFQVLSLVLFQRSEL